MKKLIIPLLFFAANIGAMENPTTDYLAKRAIVACVEKASTSTEATKNLTQLLSSQEMPADYAQKSTLAQIVFDIAQHAFPKSLTPFFELPHGIGQSLSKEYFKDIRTFNKMTDGIVLKTILKNNWDVLVGAGSANNEANAQDHLNSIIATNPTQVICSPTNQIVGFITYACQCIFGECSIKYIAVDDHARGQGLGKKLIEYVQQEALKQNIKTLYLRVFRENFGAINFYRALGFTSVNHNYDAPAFTMKKEIAQVQS